MQKAKLLTPPRREDVNASIDACLTNAERLMGDAQALEYQELGGTRLAISILAQEEYAKAFLLYMVREEFLPWESRLLSVIRNHSCKHLLAVVMEWIAPEWDTTEELEAILDAEYAAERFPPRVSSALNILYSEKIRGRDDDEQYELDVVAIARGKRDAVKQDALYIDLDKSCRTKNNPGGVTQEDAEAEYKRADRYKWIVRGLIEPDAFEGIQLRRLKEVMKIVFWQHLKLD